MGRHVGGRANRIYRFYLIFCIYFFASKILDMSFGVAQTLLKWMYTDVIDEKLGDSYILSLLSASVRYEMDSLKERLVFFNYFNIYKL